MGKRVVGIITHSGQVHCLEHASTVCSYEKEIYSTSGTHECWCGKIVGRKPSTPGASQYIRMNDGVKGKRTPPRRLVARSR